MRRIVFLVAFSFLLTSVCLADNWNTYNPFTNQPDYTYDKASEISLADIYGYYGETASPPTVESALREVGASRATVVSNTAYGISWADITTIAPSKKVLYDKIETLSGDITSVGTCLSGACTPTLSTDTDGNYVASVADGTGIDGTASAEGATYTPTLDLTEINSATFGSGTFTTLTFDAGATDPVLTMASNVFAITTGNVGIGTTLPTSKLQVSGALAADTGTFTTLKFGTSGLNLLPAGTGTNNQILKTNASGTITWQADADSGASGVQSVSAVLPLSSTGGTAPSISLAIASPAGTNPSNQLTILGDAITATHLDNIITAGTCTSCDLTVTQEGRISVMANGTGGAGDITAVGDGATGAVFAAGDTDSLLGNLIGIGATHSTAYLNIKATSTAPSFILKVADTGALDRLVIKQDGNVGIGTTNPTQKLEVIGIIKSTQTHPIYNLAIYDPQLAMDGVSKIMHSNQRITTITASLAGGSEVQYNLIIGTNHTTPIYTLQADTLTPGELTITTKGAVADTAPSGKYMYLNVTSSGTGVTGAVFNLQVDSTDY